MTTRKLLAFTLALTAAGLSAALWLARPALAAPAPPTTGTDPQPREAQDVASLNVWQRGVYEQGLQMGMTHEQAMTWARSQYVSGWNVDGP